ncbi:MAG: hypothetical protein HYT15_01690 [Candidatus Magasanikbacteria bacterium]|nr:hypothetical protein [Candidatus Magasanikbacteria bacterium]
MEEIQKEITELLGKIVFFEPEFKKEILQKMPQLEEARLYELKRILLEVQDWQTNFVKKKIAADPNFYDMIMEAKHKADRAIIEVYKQKFEDEDHKKMEIILNKIRSL